MLLIAEGNNRLEVSAIMEQVKVMANRTDEIHKLKEKIFGLADKDVEEKAKFFQRKYKQSMNRYSRVVF